MNMGAMWQVRRTISDDCACGVWHFELHNGAHCCTTRYNIKLTQSRNCILDVAGCLRCNMALGLEVVVTPSEVYVQRCGTMLNT